MWNQILPGLRITLFLTVLLGTVYPFTVTAISQLLFPKQAKGSLIRKGNRVIGSELIGQNFQRPEYFHPRPSAAGAEGYDAAASAGSNLGPTSQKLYNRVKNSVDRFYKENPDYHGPVPADLVTASASGLDPHISPASARAQSARIAKARGVPQVQIERLIEEYTEQRDFGFLGEPRVNVLRVNLALDRRWHRQ